MDFVLSEEHESIKKSVRDVVDRAIGPRAQALDISGEFPWENAKALADLGYFGLHVPEEYGGAGLDSLALALVIEEIARGCASTALMYEVHCSLCSESILKFGRVDQTRWYLPRLDSGMALGAFALTERGAGSDAGSLRTVAT
ncbi:MAG: acyl-CoA dehydrogenase family protein, partial [Bacillota bacterium]